MKAVADMYDLLPPARAAELRRHNKERLAALEERGHERRRRIAKAKALIEAQAPEARRRAA